MCFLVFISYIAVEHKFLIQNNISRYDEVNAQISFLLLCNQKQKGIVSPK